MLTFEKHGQEINRLHMLANQTASSAIDYARSAGLLLLEVKQGMKHGKFLHWVSDNAKVSLRQAQRYMAVAQGKTIPLRRLIEKSDTVSHLDSKVDQGLIVDGKWQPKSGYLYIFNDINAAYWVVPDLNPNGFHISKFYEIERDPTVPPEQYADPDDPHDEREWDGISKYDGTKHPVRQDWVDGFLRYLGLKDPTTAKWIASGACEGYARPFGEPSSAVKTTGI
jgi:hypothetical protein